MKRARLTTVTLTFVLALCAASPGRCEPSRLALVIANSQYASFPAVARCKPAAASASESLRAKGFEVIERTNLGRGEFDNAIGLLARRAAVQPTVAILYYCGYAADFNNRSFLLPASAVLSRDNDLLSQGVLVKSITESLRRTPTSAGLVLLDVFQPLDAPTDHMGQLATHVPASSFAVVVARNEPKGDGATALALALRDELAGTEAGLNSVTDGLRRRLAKAPVTPEVIAATGDAALGAESRALPAPVPPPPPPPPTAPPPEPQASFKPAPQTPAMVDEDRMSDGDRRQVQTALANIGYYSGRIDGTFGPETRAAIRRYQFEIKAELTGRITGEQATRLVTGTR